jgi:glycosyltransferase involved in cell wall biosynthesis
VSEVSPELFSLAWSPDPALTASFGRVSVDGKFLSAGGVPFFVRGVTYGAFQPDDTGCEYADHRLVERDFTQMASVGINTVRIPHTVPPRSLLDTAERLGLRVMVGLSAEQHVGYLIDGTMPGDFEARFRAKIRICAGHPALLCFALGNEIPASQARWLGRRRVTRYLQRLYSIVKEEDPHSIVTYVNYPTTEYLELPFLDMVSFNVYLETRDELQPYLARLQNVARDRPLLLTELGLDSLRHAEDAQAEALDWQIRASFEAGAAGAVVFSWTDEWFRAGEQVEDWAFGITDRHRRPKPALRAVSQAFLETPFAPDREWPRISVVLCSYNGARTIGECLDGLLALDYPDYEVIVVNDGSNDATASIAEEYPVKLINQANHGLSNARNAGLAASTGSIVAYIDDDAFPDRLWLRQLAGSFARFAHVGIGGPNLAPSGDGFVAECIAAAPGNPVHVLLSDEIAEHIPGCNMAFRGPALVAIGGFDPRFRTAGDDVDVCWRLQDQGLTIGYCPTAVVWHHRRSSIRSYWKQQYGYGKAEAQLEDKWPQRYNALGNIRWAGRIYTDGLGLANVLRQRIYHGVWGTAPFQSMQPPAANPVLVLVSMPEWYLLIAVLALLSAAGLLWQPLLWALPLLALAVAGRIAEAGISASQAPVMSKCAGRERLVRWLLTTFLHLSQPIARLLGRVSHGLTPWRWRGPARSRLPLRTSTAIWSENWREPEGWVRDMRAAISREGVRVTDGGPNDRWDLEVAGGLMAAARVLIAVEDHGAGKQYVRLGAWPKCSGAVLTTIAILALIAAAAATSAEWTTALVFAGAAALIIARGGQEAGRALAVFEHAIAGLTNAPRRGPK